ncbi:MAG: hypothetical protein RIC14_00625 [Filomicrobium sp.]
MVGGKVIEIKPKGPEVTRLWCIGTGSEKYDECAVYVETPADGILPGIGDEIWWQAGRVYFDSDRRSLKKIGNSHDPRSWFY